MIEKYEAVIKGYISDLNKAVNELIEEGYQPKGDLQLRGSHYLQVMVKYNGEETL
jgi:hypothetical protein